MRFHEKGKKIYVFGAGLLGKELVPSLEKYGCFASYIDNDFRKQADGVDGRIVISLEQYIKNGSDGLIAIRKSEM